MFKIFGYDRVLVMKFLEDNTSYVVAERRCAANEPSGDTVFLLFVLRMTTSFHYLYCELSTFGEKPSVWGGVIDFDVRWS